MARKSSANLRNDYAPQIEEFELVSALKGEMANEYIATQDANTRAAILRIHQTLLGYSTGHLSIPVAKGEDPVLVKVDANTISMNLKWLAVEIAKSLALLGIRLATFEFPQSICVECGAEIE